MRRAFLPSGEGKKWLSVYLPGFNQRYAPVRRRPFPVLEGVVTAGSVYTRCPKAMKETIY